MMQVGARPDKGKKMPTRQSQPAPQAPKTAPQATTANTQ